MIREVLRYLGYVVARRFRRRSRIPEDVVSTGRPRCLSPPDKT